MREGGRSGKNIKTGLIPRGWSSSTKPGPKPTWRGWGLRGQRLNARVPHGHWKTMTFLAALRHDRIDAPCIFDAPINGQSFLAYVVQFLCPTLKQGDIVIMDNLGSHKGKVNRPGITGGHLV